MLIQLPSLRSRTGSKNDERQRREDLVKGGWIEDLKPFLLFCCNKHCCKRWLRFLFITFLLVCYFGNDKRHCIFSEMKRNLLFQLVLTRYVIHMWQQDLLFIMTACWLVRVHHVHCDRSHCLHICLVY
jgi:hypothetical protein